MGRKPKLLLIEDNPADARLVEVCLEEMEVDVELELATDAPAALSRLAQDPLPELVMLDLSLPSGDGRRLLAKCRGDERLKHLPIVVYTSSSDRMNLRDCYAKGANAYIVKPEAFDDLRRALDSMLVLFLNLSEPSDEPADEPPA